MMPEFSRRVAIDTIGSGGRTLTVAADAAERTALAKRFGLERLDSLEAVTMVSAEAGTIVARGTLRAVVVQSCVVLGDPVPCVIDETFALRFVDPPSMTDATVELELDDADCDVLPHDGSAIDLGEAVAQSLGLALDPFPRASTLPVGEQVWTAGPQANPFAGLKGLISQS